MNLRVISIVKDEGRYLEEWITYHLSQGVDYFHIYNNDSTDNTVEILEKYRKLGVLTHKIYPRFVDPQVSTQLSMYKYFLAENRHLDDWCAFLDADEFLYFTPYASIKTWFDVYLAKQLSMQLDIGGVVLPWLLYGSNYEEEYRAKPVIERFTKRAKMLDKHVKSIVIPSKIEGVGRDAHAFNAGKSKLINIFGEIVPSFTPVFVDRDLPEYPAPRINHYHTKSRAEYKERCERGRIDVNGKRDFLTSFIAHDRNEVEDLGALTWVRNSIK